VVVFDSQGSGKISILKLEDSIFPFGEVVIANNQVQTWINSTVPAENVEMKDSFTQNVSDQK